MEENKNISTEHEPTITEAPTAEPPAADIPAPDLNTGTAAPLEQGGIAPADPGDVVVSFDKIEELLTEIRKHITTPQGIKLLLSGTRC